MSSITQTATFATRNPCAQNQEALTPPPALVEQFYAEAKRQIVTGDYLRRKWLPRYGPRFYSLIKALRGHCDYDIIKGEARCFPSETTLAEECHVTRRTIITWLARVEAGEEHQYPGLKVGDFCHHRHGKALQQFLRIKPKLRYDRHGQRSVKAVNDYFIRMDDPPVPEDIPLIWEKARELAVEYLKRQAEEQEREARRQEFTAKAAQVAFSGPAGFTCNNVKKMHTQQCEKNAHNRPFLTATYYRDRDRSIPEREPAEVSIRNANIACPSKKALVGGEARGGAQCQQTNSEAKEKPRPAAESTTDRAEKPAPTAFERALLAAEDEAGALLVEVLRLYGDAEPVDGMGTILVALVDAGAPVERLSALVELGQHRLRRRKEAGGHIGRPQAYYIGIMQRLAQEAKARGWDVAAIEAQDQAKHANILRQRAMRCIGHRRTYIEPEVQAEAAEEVVPAPEAAQEAGTEESETVVPQAFGGWTDVDLPAAPAGEEPERLAPEGGVPERTEAEVQAEEGSRAEAAQPARQQGGGEETPRQQHPRTQVSARQVWQSTLERVEPKISPAMFNSWFVGTRGLALRGQELTVGVPNTFSRSHLETRFYDLVCSILCGLVGPEADVHFEVKGQEEDPWK